jgi:ABC-type nitrate/sulfonate/bicarbonate transport system permease component
VRPQPPDRRARLVLVTLSVIGLGLLWEVVGRRSNSLLLPSATETAVALVRLTTTSRFWRAAWLSNQALLLGFPLAVATGVAGGLALARWKQIDRWVDVYLALLLVVPKSAVMPLIVMVLGFGLLPRALVVFTFAFPVIVVTVRAGVREVDQRLLSMAHAFCASEAQIWRRILVPGARPAVMTAVRLGLARAVAGMVTVELLLVAVGIGQLILTFRATFDAGSLYAVILLVVAEAVLLIRVAGLLERRFGPWAGSGMVAE